jgi:CO/xanthine dehydrogenase FAD-binding subunit
MRALEAERFLAGKILEEAALSEAADLTARSAQPVAGSAGERFELVKGLTYRAIAEALARARAGDV